MASFLLELLTMKRWLVALVAAGLLGSGCLITPIPIPDNVDMGPYTSADAPAYYDAGAGPDGIVPAADGPALDGGPPYDAAADGVASDLVQPTFDGPVPPPPDGGPVDGGDAGDAGDSGVDGSSDGGDGGPGADGGDGGDAASGDGPAADSPDGADLVPPGV
jgi:hypothetical protein